MQTELFKCESMTFAQWQEFATKVREMGERVARMRFERGILLAKSAGIGEDLCCIHNAAIDDNMTGWCANNPHRLKIAKQANYLCTELSWQPTRLARRIIENSFKKIRS